MPYLPTIEIDYTNRELNESQAASIIWLHGLGASGNDFAALVPELKTMLGTSANNIRFIFPHAAEIPVTINGGVAMPAWYDILDMPTQVKIGESAERKINQNQLLSSAKDIQKLIDREIKRGIKSKRILILGFSQGGAVAYHAALTYPHTLGGLAGLSTYFPILTAPNAFVPNKHNQNIDIQIYHGNIDPVVNQSLGLKAQNDLTNLGYQTQYHNYPMEHQVCYEQVQDIAHWIKTKLD